MTTWNSDLYNNEIANTDSLNPKWGKGCIWFPGYVSQLISGIFYFLVFTFEFQPHTLTFAQIFGNILLYIN